MAHARQLGRELGLVEAEAEAILLADAVLDSERGSDVTVSNGHLKGSPLKQILDQQEDEDLDASDMGLGSLLVSHMRETAGGEELDEVMTAQLEDPLILILTLIGGHCSLPGRFFTTEP